MLLTYARCSLWMILFDCRSRLALLAGPPRSDFSSELTFRRLDAWLTGMLMPLEAGLPASGKLTAGLS